MRPLVVVLKKSGKVRLCIDMREANKAIQREKHVMPTIDDLIADLNGAQVFSTLDLAQGCHQYELDPNSHYITTFSTNKALYRYKRLMFRVNAASETFQNAVAEMLGGLEGAKNISDNIIVFGRTQDEHDRNLQATFQRLAQHNARLNPGKCKFSQPTITFFGHVFGKNGVQADPNKIATVKEAPPPTNVSEVRSLLGMAQYVSRFIPNFADITTPLRRLTHQDRAWSWGRAEEEALRKLKDALTKAPSATYFDPTKHSTLLVDASPTGLGAILTQEGRVISYASRALSDVESRYSQTEREMLAVVWGAEHFHLYLYRATFDILTDHKPLLGIFKNHRPASACIERWRIRLMPYSLDLKYRPGKNDANPVDYISRHPCVANGTTDHVEDYVNYVARNTIPNALTISEIHSAIAKDSTYQALIHAIRSGN